MTVRVTECEQPSANYLYRVCEHAKEDKNVVYCDAIKCTCLCAIIGFCECGFASASAMQLEKRYPYGRAMGSASASARAIKDR